MADRRRVVTCALGAAWEAPLLRIAEHPAAAMRIESRCGDPGEALGTVMRDGTDVVVAQDVPGWWDRDVVARFEDHGARVLIVGAAAPPGARACGDAPEAIVAAIHELDAGDQEDRPAATAVPSGGHLTAVWGGHGAPGRTTFAIHAAAAAATRRDPTLLIDADVWAPSVALRLGIDRSGGLVHAVRAASRGDDPLDAVVSRGGGLDVITGLARPELWAEVREQSLEALLTAAQLAYRLVTVDLAAPIEEDEELAFDQVPFRRNLTTRHVLRRADRIVLVIGADPVALARGITAYRTLAAEMADRASAVEVVVNAPPDRRAFLECQRVIERHLGVPVRATLPADSHCNASLREGCTVPELGRRSAYWRAITDLTSRSAS